VLYHQIHHVTKNRSNVALRPSMSRSEVPVRIAHGAYDRHFLRPAYAGDAAHGTHRALEFFVTDMSTCNSLTERWSVRERYHTGARPLRRNYWSFYVRLFGVTAAGHSVCAYVAGWTPYIYVRVPSAWRGAEVRDFAGRLRDALKTSGERALAMADRNVTECELVHRVPVYGYCGDVRVPLVRVRFANAQTKRAATCGLADHARERFATAAQRPAEPYRMPLERCVQVSCPCHDAIRAACVAGI